MGKKNTGRRQTWRKKLGITEIMVNIMENQNKGLDSIERRRTLATILRIPPVLLGLGSLDLIAEIVAGHNITVSKQTNAKVSKIGKNTIKLYQDTYSVYKKLYAEGLSYASAHDIEKWMKRIERDANNIDGEARKILLRNLWDWEVLCAKVYGSDLNNWNKVFEHLDNAREIAIFLDDRDLQASSLCHSGIFHFRQGRLGLAKMDIDGALVYAKGALPQTKGIILSKKACIYADDTSLSGIILAQNLFDESEKYIDGKSEVKSISFGKDDYLLDKAYTFIASDRPAKALEFIDDAERHIDPSKKRFLVFLDILRAKCYIKLKKPEYEQVVNLLEGAIEDSKEIRIARNIDHIEKLYSKLLESPYSNAPDTIGLGLMLQNLHLKNSQGIEMELRDLRSRYRKN